MCIWLVQVFKYDEEMSISLLESDLKMSKSHAYVVHKFDKNVSHLSTSVNLYEPNEQFFFFYEQNNYWTDRTNIGTII